MPEETFLVTGSTGCIGAWVLRNLVREGVRVVAGHVSGDFHRPRYLLTDEEFDRIEFVRLDIGELEPLLELVERQGITRIIHLAGLQIPFCKADPSRGARINVQGSINILEAARRFPEQVKGLSYASSVAVFGPDELYPVKPVPDSAPLGPETLYGVYKMADEMAARVYWRDWQVPSVGIRPTISYGVGRDQGLSSDASKAILAAAARRPFHIKFSGRISLQYNDDAARIFIAAARSDQHGALACNLRNDVLDVADFVSLLLKMSPPKTKITFEKNSPLPFPLDLDDSLVRKLLGQVPHTPLEAAVSESLAFYKELLDRGEIDLGQLG